MIYLYLMEQSFYIASGSSHLDLAQRIANNLNMKLCKQKIKKFKNSEIGVDIMDNVRNRDIFLIQTGFWDKENNKSVNDFIMETLILIDAYKRSAAKSITLIMPNYPYARQDKKDESRAPISAKLLANVFESAGVNRMVMMDLHAPQIQGFFNIPVDNIYSISIFKEYFDLVNRKDDDYIIVSPDAGGMKRAIKFGKIFKVPVTMMYKQRDYSKISTIDSMEVLGDKKQLENKIAIICDDMCDSGGTLIKCIEILEKHNVKEVWCFITHGIFSEPALERINTCKILTRMVTLNTMPQSHNLSKCNKLVILDCSKLFSFVIGCLLTGDSISKVFYNNENKI